MSGGREAGGGEQKNIFPRILASSSGEKEGNGRGLLRLRDRGGKRGKDTDGVKREEGVSVRDGIKIEGPPGDTALFFFFPPLPPAAALSRTFIVERDSPNASQRLRFL